MKWFIVLFAVLILSATGTYLWFVGGNYLYENSEILCGKPIPGYRMYVFGWLCVFFFLLYAVITKKVHLFKWYTSVAVAFKKIQIMSTKKRVIICVGVAVFLILMLTVFRYQFISNKHGTYKIDRITGKIYMIYGDQEIEVHKSKQ